ncbi:flagellar assembly protein FliW [Natroniella sulfidigena]|uniref:flagellar assembly protein FliW n=1 Tax=Natroniella sulfidigena TaxID=723921 RepID=UPI00200A10E4|nr:flagellar assembly protein FliW [Natroniella sulfidigena]MCK8816029.1 flagellar assembly protein FliW [Natroniella sulfidigena]
MELESARFGTIEIEGAEILTFKQGLYGFEDETQFVILDEEDSPFFWLHAVNNPELCFIVAEPGNFYQGYEFELSKKAQQELEIEDKSEVMVINLVVVPEDHTKMTMNLKAPIVINQKKNLGRQIILENEDYSVKYPLFKEQKSVSSG